VLKFSGIPLLIEFAIYIDQDLKLLIVGADLKFIIRAARLPRFGSGADE
jgi:hypothetical protein